MVSFEAPWACAHLNRSALLHDLTALARLRSQPVGKRKRGGPREALCVSVGETWPSSAVEEAPQ